MLSEISTIRENHWKTIRNKQINDIKRQIRQIHSQPSWKNTKKIQCMICLQHGNNNNNHLTTITQQYAIDCLQYPNPHCQQHQKILQPITDEIFITQPMLFPNIFQEDIDWGTADVIFAKRTINLIFRVICWVHDHQYSDQHIKGLLNCRLIQWLVNGQFVLVVDAIDDAMEKILFANMVSQIQVLLLSIIPSVFTHFPHCCILQDLLSQNTPKITSLVWCAICSILPLPTQCVPSITHLSYKYIFSKTDYQHSTIEQVESEVKFVICAWRQLQIDDRFVKQWGEKYVKQQNNELYSYLCEYM